MENVKSIFALAGIRRGSATYAFFKRLNSEVIKPLRNAPLRLAARSRVLSALYYALGSSAFSREQQTTLAGKLVYQQSLASASASVYGLRRNVHRLEKGLIMRPRRKVFAVDYIDETVEAYLSLKSGPHAETYKDELQWSRDVLGEYFYAVGNRDEVRGARNRFMRSGEPASQDPRTPYQRDLSSGPSVDYDALRALSVRRRSVRWYRPKTVPRSLTDQALEVAAQAPSACNRQPYHYRIFDNPAEASRIAAIPNGTKGYSQNVPALAVLIGDQSAYFSERDRHVIYIDASLSAMSFVLALESQGLSSCCINWPDIEPLERTMAKELGLKAHQRVIMLIAFGYPDPTGHVPRSQKQSLENLRTYQT
ncbi:nitroreductase family protein [Pelagicoccus sp. SDUM812003]|uniref:nitroreductase family protein n=1 Tax=Pelagicoccus sp. SDUM812003 TaxID=3041267 RepID=UPI00280DEE34|nr:nitroreductase family protein [Pelagicoccus sp. SDUM812003]MDQ8204659.1 nitroreductase family protein [Pelagicoccus sp. SDUM812003]